MTTVPAQPIRLEWAWPFRCLSCRRSYPAQGFPYQCPVCGGLYDFSTPVVFDPAPRGPGRSEGLSRYRKSLPLPPGAALVSLGEGETPLLEAKAGGENVYFKCEHLNPTGSFKDRGAAALVSALAASGVREAIEDSSGNAGAAFAAYAARAGIRARVYVPASASGPKRLQIQAYGAELVAVPGPRSAAADAARRAAEAGQVYASHAHHPHGLAGMTTIAFEIVEQLGQAPGAVVAPVGQGSLILGMERGFRAMEAAGKIQEMPQLVGVQAQACAPLWAVARAGAAGLGFVQEGETIAEGIRIRNPLRGDAVLEAVAHSGGTWVAVTEEAILQGRSALARLGFFVEPTSAVVWPALAAVASVLRRPIVAVLTGSGFKAMGGRGR
jgi:threonine synthase